MMRPWFSVPLAAALIACGSSGGPSKQKLAEMSPEQACQVVTAKMRECKTQLLLHTRLSLMSQGRWPDEAMDESRFVDRRLKRDDMCGRQSAEQLEKAVSCFASDCSEYTACLVNSSNPIAATLAPKWKCPEGQTAYRIESPRRVVTLCIAPDGSANGPFIRIHGDTTLRGQYTKSTAVGTWSQNKGGKLEEWIFRDGIRAEIRTPTP